MRNGILVRGARQLVTLQGRSGPRRGGEMRDLAVIQDGSVLIVDGVIQRVGPTRQVENVIEARKADEINAAGRVVMPAFVDAHTQLVTAPARITGASSDTAPFLQAVHWVRNTSPSTLEAHAQHYIEAAVRHGTLSLGSASGYGLNAPGELKILRVLAQIGEPRVALIPAFFGAFAKAPEFDDPSAYLAWLGAEMVPKLRDRKLARYVAARCDSGAFTREQLRSYLDTVSRAGFPLQLHGDQHSRSGSVALAVEYGAAGVAGLNHIDESDVELLSRSPTIATLLPGDIARGADVRRPPARELLDQGAAVALASGFNPSVASTFNMQTVVAMACEWLSFTAEEALSAATVNAAHALGSGGSCGTLECGRNADLLILNVSDYREIPLHYGCNLVSVAMRRGRTVWREGPLTCGSS